MILIATRYPVIKYSYGILFNYRSSIFSNYPNSLEGSLDLCYNP